MDILSNRIVSLKNLPIKGLTAFVPSSASAIGKKPSTARTRPFHAATAQPRMTAATAPSNIQFIRFPPFSSIYNRTACRENFHKRKAAWHSLAHSAALPYFYCFFVASFCVFSFCVVSFLAETLAFSVSAVFVAFVCFFPFVMA